MNFWGIWTSIHNGAGDNNAKLLKKIMLTQSLIDMCVHTSLQQFTFNKHQFKFAIHFATK